jgi:hypothetical protein
LPQLFTISLTIFTNKYNKIKIITFSILEFWNHFTTTSSRIHVDWVLTIIGMLEQRCDKPEKTATNIPATTHSFTCIHAKAYLATHYCPCKLRTAENRGAWGEQTHGPQERKGANLVGRATRRTCSASEEGTDNSHAISRLIGSIFLTLINFRIISPCAANSLHTGKCERKGRHHRRQLLFITPF